MGRRGGTPHRRQNLQQPIDVDVDSISGKRMHLTGGGLGLPEAKQSELAWQRLPEVSRGHSSDWLKCQLVKD